MFRSVDKICNTKENDSARSKIPKLRQKWHWLTGCKIENERFYMFWECLPSHCGFNNESSPKSKGKITTTKQTTPCKPLKPTTPKYPGLNLAKSGFVLLFLCLDKPFCQEFFEDLCRVGSQQLQECKGTLPCSQYWTHLN